MRLPARDCPPPGEGADLDLGLGSSTGFVTRPPRTSPEALENLTKEELFAYWSLWLLQAQDTNDEDEALYSHGVFDRDPSVDS